MIAEARRDDAAAVVAQWEACGLTRAWNPPARDFAQAVEGAASTVLVARDGGAITASVMVGSSISRLRYWAGCSIRPA